MPQELWIYTSRWCCRIIESFLCEYAKVKIKGASGAKYYVFGRKTEHYMQQKRTGETVFNPISPYTVCKNIISWR
jgi:hypothetical protein